MVESSSNSFYSFIRSASFGIEMNLLEELDFVANNKDSSDIQIANCTSFFNAINTKICHTDFLTIICTDKQYELLNRIYIKNSKSVKGNDFSPNTIFKILHNAFSTGKAQPVLINELESNSIHLKKIKFIFAKNSEEDMLKSISDMNTIPFITLKDIIGDNQNSNNKGFKELFKMKSMIRRSRKDDKAKKYPLKDFFKTLNLSSNNFIVYDNYLFITRNDAYKEYFLGIPCEKSVSKKLYMNKKEFDKINIKLSFWLNSFPKGAKKTKIITKMPYDVSRPIAYLDLYEEELKKRINDILEIKKNEDKKDEIVEELNLLKLEIEKIDSVIDDFNNISFDNDSLVLDNDNNFIFKEDEIYKKDFFRDLANTEFFSKENENYTKYLDLISLIEKENTLLKKAQIKEDEFTSFNVDNLVDKIKIQIDNRNSLLRIIIEDLIAKKELLNENQKNKILDIEKIDIKNQDLSLELKQLKLIESYLDSIILLDHEEKASLEKTQKLNLHDRVYLNDHSLITWGKGIDIFEDPKDFKTKNVRLVHTAPSTSYSVFNYLDRDISDSKYETKYALFDIIAEDFNSLKENK